MFQNLQKFAIKFVSSNYMMTKKCQETLTCDRHITRKPLPLTLQVVKCSPTLTSFIYMRGKLVKNNIGTFALLVF